MKIWRAGKSKKPGTMYVFMRNFGVFAIVIGLGLIMMAMFILVLRLDPDEPVKLALFTILPLIFTGLAGWISIRVAHITDSQTKLFLEDDSSLLFYIELNEHKIVTGSPIISYFISNALTARTMNEYTDELIRKRNNPYERGVHIYRVYNIKSHTNGSHVVCDCEDYFGNLKKRTLFVDKKIQNYEELMITMYRLVNKDDTPEEKSRNVPGLCISGAGFVVSTVLAVFCHQDIAIIHANNMVYMLFGILSLVSLIFVTYYIVKMYRGEK